MTTNDNKAEEAAQDKAREAQAGPSTSAIPDDPAPAYEPIGQASPSNFRSDADLPEPVAGQAAPTASSPFNFPSDADLPPYSPPAATGVAGSLRPIAVPQLAPDPASSFITSFAPSLLNHGVTPETWKSFLGTMSAFLTAKVSDRAISHAGDMAKHFVEGPKNLGNRIFAHTKMVGKDIASSAKRGDIIGAAMGAVGGAISIPVTSALGAVSTAASLPASAVGAIVKKPQTPGQRAAAYAAVANEKWLHRRGLHAQLLDSNELAQLLGVSVSQLLQPAQETKNNSASGLLQALEGRIAPLEVQQAAAILELSPNTLWLVLSQLVREDGPSRT